MNKTICPFCEVEINENDEKYICPNCETIYHKECWDCLDYCVNCEKERKKTEKTEEKINQVNQQFDGKLKNLKKQWKKRNGIRRLIWIVVAGGPLVFGIATDDVDDYLAFPIIVTVLSLVIGIVSLIKYIINKERIEENCKKEIDTIKELKIRNDNSGLIATYKDIFRKYTTKFNSLIENVTPYIQHNTSIDGISSNYIAINKQKNSLIFFNINKPQAYMVNVSNNSVQKPKEGSIQITGDFLIENIVYFKLIGDVQYTSKVSGGGSSIGGAIVGGLVAGDAGAIIGSRQEVKTSVQEHDSRQTLLKLENSEFYFEKELYEVLMKLIPKKEYTYLDIKSKANSLESQENPNVKQIQSPVSVEQLSIENGTISSVADELLKFKTLLDQGVITQEEFNQQKSKLLS